MEVGRLNSQQNDQAKEARRAMRNHSAKICDKLSQAGSDSGNSLLSEVQDMPDGWTGHDVPNQADPFAKGDAKEDAKENTKKNTKDNPKEPEATKATESPSPSRSKQLWKKAGSATSKTDP